MIQDALFFSKLSQTPGLCVSQVMVMFDVVGVM